MKASAFISVEMRKALVSAFLLVYLPLVLVVASPSSAITDAVSAFVRSNLNYFGLFENYGVYSPDPAKYNQNVRAVVQFQDGSSSTWQYPNLYSFNSNDIARALQEKWVELGYYLFWNSKNVNMLVPDLARYVIRIHTAGDYQPVSVKIYRDFYPIEVPGKKACESDEKRQENQLFKEYSVKDLE